MKSIEVIISPSGATKIETRGFIGSECRQADEFLRKALGSSEHESLSPEYHATPSIQQASSILRY